MDSFSSSSYQVTPRSLQLKAQFAQAYAEEFLETVRRKCFAKPGSSLSGSESSCISRRVECYIEATGVVGRALFSSQQ